MKQKGDFGIYVAGEEDDFCAYIFDLVVQQEIARDFVSGSELCIITAVENASFSVCAGATLRKILSNFFWDRGWSFSDRGISILAPSRHVLSKAIVGRNVIGAFLQGKSFLSDDVYEGLVLSILLRIGTKCNQANRAMSSDVEPRTDDIAAITLQQYAPVIVFETRNIGTIDVAYCSYERAMRRYSAILQGIDDTIFHMGTRQAVVPSRCTEFYGEGGVDGKRIRIRTDHGLSMTAFWLGSFSFSEHHVADFLCYIRDGEEAIALSIPDLEILWKDKQVS